MCRTNERPNPEPFDVVHQGVATAVKLLEDFLLLVGGDADAAILDFQLDRAVHAVQLYGDVLLIFRVFQRIVHQVKERSRDRFAVDVHRWDVGRNVLFEAKSVLLDLEAIRIQSGMYEFTQVGLLEFVLFSSGIDSGEIQNIVDECGQAFALLADDAEILLIFLLCR